MSAITAATITKFGKMKAQPPIQAPQKSPRRYETGIWINKGPGGRLGFFLMAAAATRLATPRMLNALNF